MNPSADTQIIYPGTIVAQVSPVQGVVNPNSKIDEEESSTAPFIIISLSAGMTTLSCAATRKQPSFPAYLRLTRLDEEGELRTDLINLLERSQEHLTPKQSQA
jgi:predicted amidohydrolase YtcJ